MSDRGRVFLEGIRFAGDVVTKPFGVVSLWKYGTGGKTVGCLPSVPIPELFHAAALLPISLESPKDLSLVSGQIDAWLVGAESTSFPDPSIQVPCFAFPRVVSRTIEEAVDRIEALAEWAGSVSGSAASEGSLWKSIRAYAIRRSLQDALDERCARENAFLTPEERIDILRAGGFLPPEAHSRLLSSILGIEHVPPPLSLEAERGDPIILLAKRLM